MAEDKNNKFKWKAHDGDITSEWAEMQFSDFAGKHLVIDFLTSWTEKDPLVDDIITLHFLLSIAKVSKARHSCWKKRFKKYNILQKA